MTSWLCVEFPDQVEGAARWAAEADEGRTRGLLAVRREVEPALDRRGLTYESLSEQALRPEDYEELDRASRHCARTWNEHTAHPKARFGDRDLAELYYSQMSLYFYWVYRLARMLDRWAVSKNPGALYCFQRSYSVVSARVSGQESPLKDLLGALGLKQDVPLHVLPAGSPRSGQTKRASPRHSAVRSVRSAFYFFHKLLDRPSAPEILFSGSPHLLGALIRETRRSREYRPRLLREYFDRPSFGFFCRDGIVTTALAEELPSEPSLELSVGDTGFTSTLQPGAFVFGGLDLTAAIAPKIHFLIHLQFPQALRRLERLAGLLSRYPLRALVVDEDVTAHGKSLVWAAESRGIKSIVCQHGFPGDRDGFAPVSATYFGTWGEQSTQRMESWGEKPERLVALGAPHYDPLFSQARREGRPAARPGSGQILFVLPQLKPSWIPGRANSDHLNLAYTDALLEEVFRALAGRPSCRLLIKASPRETQMEGLSRVIQKHAGAVRWSMAEKTLPAHRFMKDADLVLGNESTCMLEALILGIPSVCINLSGKGDNTDLVQKKVSLGVSRRGELAPALDEVFSETYRAAFEAARPALIRHYFSEGGGAARNFMLFVLSGRMAASVEKKAVLRV